MSNEHNPDDPIINDVLNETAEKETLMTGKEMKLRDQINKELAQKGFHLRLAFLQTSNGFSFDFVRPIDQWFNEWPEVDRYVTERVGQLMRGQ